MWKEKIYISYKNIDIHTITLAKYCHWYIVVHTKEILPLAMNTQTVLNNHPRYLKVLTETLGLQHSFNSRNRSHWGLICAILGQVPDDVAFHSHLTAHSLHSRSSHFLQYLHPDHSFFWLHSRQPHALVPENQNTTSVTTWSVFFIYFQREYRGRLDPNCLVKL